MIWSLAAPFVIGGCMAFVLNIPVRNIERIIGRGSRYRSKGVRICSILLVLTAVMLLLTGMIWLVGVEISSTIEEISEKAPDLIRRIEATDGWWKRYVTQINIEESMKGVWNALQGALDDIAGGLWNTIVGMGRKVVRIGVGSVMAVYMLLQKERLMEQSELLLRAFLKESKVRRIKKVCTMADQIFSSYITGQCTEAVVLGSVFAAAMFIFRFPYALMIGTVIGVTSFLPVVGSFAGCITGAFLIAVNDPGSALWFVIMFLGIQQLESNFIYPRIVGKSVGLPPLLVLSAITFGGTLAGPGGIFMSVPVCAFLYAGMKEVVYRRMMKSS